MVVGELGDIKGWGRSWWLTRLGINSAILEDVRQWWWSRVAALGGVPSNLKVNDVGQAVQSDTNVVLELEARKRYLKS